MSLAYSLQLAIGCVRRRWPADPCLRGQPVARAWVVLAWVALAACSRLVVHLREG